MCISFQEICKMLNILIIKKYNYEELKVFVINVFVVV